MGEDRVGEKVGWDFDKLGMREGSAEILVGQVDGPWFPWLSHLASDYRYLLRIHLPGMEQNLIFLH